MCSASMPHGNKYFEAFKRYEQKTTQQNIPKFKIHESRSVKIHAPIKTSCLTFCPCPARMEISMLESDFLITPFIC